MSDKPPPTALACPDVQVPGHHAVVLRAQATSCDVAKAVAAPAEGRGRAPYQLNGFACEGTNAAGGDTEYVCTLRDARVTFLDGTARTRRACGPLPSGAGPCGER